MAESSVMMMETNVSAYYNVACGVDRNDLVACELTTIFTFSILQATATMKRWCRLITRVLARFVTTMSFSHWSGP
jgi:hypothetical protein